MTTLIHRFQDELCIDSGNQGCKGDAGLLLHLSQRSFLCEKEGLNHSSSGLLTLFTPNCLLFVMRKKQ